MRIWIIGLLLAADSRSSNGHHCPVVLSPKNLEPPTAIVLIPAILLGIDARKSAFKNEISA
jgi:hypothetical protein